MRPRAVAAQLRSLAVAAAFAGHRPARTLPALAWASAPLLGVLAVSVPAVAFAADSVRQIEIDVDNLGNNLQNIQGDLRAATAREKQYPLEQRYLDASIAYERGNFATAAVLLDDLTRNPAFQATRNHADALAMLGEAHYQQHNYMGAKRALDKLLSLSERKHFAKALQLLVDISVRLARWSEVETYAKRLPEVPDSTGRTELIYQFARSYFAAERFDKSEPLLLQVSVGEKRYHAARFYLGAIMVHRGQIDRALSEFRDISESGKTRDERRRPDQVILDYANLALGRLYLKQKKYTEAIYHYGLIDRNSRVYDEALFELAATHVAAGDPRKALSALDLLLLGVADDRVAVQAAVLRGRINLIERQYDKADASYKEVVERYSAIAGELRSFASSDKNLELFFQWLLNRGANDYTTVRPVSERVAKYVETDEDLARVVGLFDDMAAERADVKECVKLAATLEAAFRESSRLDMFPDLRDAWMKTTEANNRAIEIGRRIVEALRALALPRMSPEEAERAKALYEARKKLEAAFAKVPPNKGAFEQRKTRVAGEYANLAADLSIQRTQLAAVKEELLAVERLLAERLYGGEGGPVSKADEADIRKSLEEVRNELRRANRELEEVSQAVEVQAQTVGAGDKVTGNEALLRIALAAAQRAEQAQYRAVLARTGDDRTQAERLQAARDRLDRDVYGRGANLLDEIAKRAQERLADLKSMLAAEQRNIAEYQAAVRNFEDDAKVLARLGGYSLVRRAQESLSQIVLEADLGLVDVAWQRKNEKSAEIRALQDERAQKTKGLGDVLRELGTGDGDE